MAETPLPESDQPSFQPWALERIYRVTCEAIIAPSTDWIHRTHESQDHAKILAEYRKLKRRVEDGDVRKVQLWVADALWTQVPE